MDSLVKNEIIKLFNAKPKNAIAEIKKWCADNDKYFAEEIAKFFYEEKSNLNLEFVGDYLGTDGEDNRKVLENFVKQFDLKEKDYLGSLREFLQSFKLPGEAQKIDRLVESFGSKYYEQNLNGEIKGKDAAYILAFQVIMLNTDLHNVSIANSKRMTFEQLKNNLRGTNENQDFNDSFLKKIYDGIKNEPFVLNFVDSSPGYEIGNINSQNDETFKKLNRFLEGKRDIKGIFSKLQSDNDLMVEFKTPKTLLNEFVGYEGSITIKDAKGGKAEVQIYKPNILSRWFLGEKSKVIIQPLNEEGKQPIEQSVKLAAQITASFATKVTSIKATYDYLREDLKSQYENVINPKEELGKYSPVLELNKNIEETTKSLWQSDQRISDISKVNSKASFEDLIHSDLGKDVNTNSSKPLSFDTELAQKVLNRRVSDDSMLQAVSVEEKIDSHAKRLEELNKRRAELENRKKELEIQKVSQNISREEKWRITAELESISKQFISIEKECNTINTSVKRAKQFDNKDKSSSPIKGEPTAADLQQQGAIAAIKRMKEEKMKQQQAEAAQCLQNIPNDSVLKSSPPPPPPPPPLSMPKNNVSSPPLSPIPNGIKKEAKGIGKQLSKEVGNNKEELLQKVAIQRKKLEKQNSGIGM